MDNCLITVRKIDKKVDNSKNSKIPIPSNRPNTITDSSPNSLGLFLQRIKRGDFITVYLITLIVWSIFILSYIPGINSQWYASLTLPAVDEWIPRVAWIIATILSYIGLYILWEHATPEEIPRDLSVTVLYVIGAFITIAWSAILYQGRSISIALWVSGILFIFQFWLFIHVWYISRIAAIFLIPLVIMYLYLVYSMVNLASINDISL